MFYKHLKMFLYHIPFIQLKTILIIR